MSNGNNMLLFNSCCFCVPLRTGSITIGYIKLVYNVLLIITSILWIVLATSNTTGHIGATFLAIGIIVLVIVLVLLAFTIVLLVGLHKDRRDLIKAYLIYGVVYMIMYTILFILNCFDSVDLSVAYIIVTIIQIVLYTYFLLVIRSHYIKMGESNALPYGA